VQRHFPQRRHCRDQCAESLLVDEPPDGHTTEGTLWIAPLSGAIRYRTREVTEVQPVPDKVNPVDVVLTADQTEMIDVHLRARRNERGFLDELTQRGVGAVDIPRMGRKAEWQPGRPTQRHRGEGRFIREVGVKVTYLRMGSQQGQPRLRCRGYGGTAASGKERSVRGCDPESPRKLRWGIVHLNVL